LPKINEFYENPPLATDCQNCHFYKAKVKQLSKELIKKEA